MKLFRISLLFSLLAGLIFTQGCDDTSTGPDFSNVPPPYERSEAISDSTIEDGLKYFVIEEGAGPFEVVPPDAILVKYTGRTTEGIIFDSSFRSETDQTFLFQNLTPNVKFVGNRSVQPLIEGLRKGVLGMQEGEKRIIEIPPAFGYSDSRRGTNGFDLRGDTLIYNVELVSIQN